MTNVAQSKDHDPITRLCITRKRGQSVRIGNHLKIRVGNYSIDGHSLRIYDDGKQTHHLRGLVNGQTICLPGEVTVYVLKIKGEVLRLLIECRRSVKIVRADAIQKSAVAAGAA